MNPYNEKQIILLLQQGNDTGYRYIYDHYYPLLCSIAFHYLNDIPLSALIVDDLIINIWEKRHSIQIKSSLRSYLVTAVRNRCINHLNSLKKRREINFSELNNHSLPSDNLIDKSIPESSKILEEEFEEIIKIAIEKLPDECRIVFTLSRFEQMRYEQIASKLGISINTVKYHMKNALSKLSSELEKYLVLLFLFFF